MKHAVDGPLALLVSALVLSSSVAAAEDHSHHHPPPQQQAAEKPAAVQVKYADTALLDQSGRQVRLGSDVFGDKLVVIDFAYTSCTTVCPVLTALLAQVQTQLGERLGKEVQLVTITVDPARDTPARLTEYAAKHGVKPGWTLFLWMAMGLVLLMAYLVQVPLWS